MQDKRKYIHRAAYLKKAVSERRKKLRQKALEHFGNKCQICGYSKSPRALSFHHLDPKTKKFGISMRGMTRSWDKIESELKKCVLICSNCHAEVHDGITQLPEEILK
jgi:5-methylcytosine-specific restriction endonuclease McrA